MIYLASRSPQRKRLLRQARLRFKVVRSRYRERFHESSDGVRVAVFHATGKAEQAVLPRSAAKGSHYVLGADTLVLFRGKVLGKPQNMAHARQMLQAFSGRRQTVVTAVALKDLKRGVLRTFVERSEVFFKKMRDKDIERYLATGEYRNKAGAFALQGRGKRYIAKVKGSRTNVIGLPIEKLKKIMGTCT